jgi:endonuclease III
MAQQINNDGSLLEYMKDYILTNLQKGQSYKIKDIIGGFQKKHSEYENEETIRRSIIGLTIDHKSNHYYNKNNDYFFCKVDRNTLCLIDEEKDTHQLKNITVNKNISHVKKQNQYPEINIFDEDLGKVHEVLFSKKSEMKEFMKYYVFKKKDINIDTFIDDKEQFIRFIDFCLNTRNRPVNKDIDEGIQYFSKNYNKIIQCINDKNIEELKKLVCHSRGVGQKIGSMLLEFIYLYSKYSNENVIKKLFVPIDTHIKRIFNDSFGVKTPNINSKYDDNRYLEFQYSLDKYANNKGRVYFDYLWFVGKMFCTKITDDKSRGYKLCKYCWIREYCKNEKWL